MESEPDFIDVRKEDLHTYVPSIPGCMSLREELLQRCSPKNFVAQNDEGVLDLADDIYAEASRLPADTQDDNAELVALRDRAMDELGLKFSTARLYRMLAYWCNPERYMSPYNHDKVKKANYLYARINERPDDIRWLEGVREEAKSFIEEVKAEEKAEEEARAKAREEAKAKKKDDFYEAIGTIVGIIVLIAVFFVLVGIVSYVGKHFDLPDYWWIVLVLAVLAWFNES